MDLCLASIRQKAAHLLAMALATLYPKIQLLKGQATSTGFFYDFNLHENIDPSQFPLIEERMLAIAMQNSGISEMEMMVPNAMELFRHHKQDLKVAYLKTLNQSLVKVVEINGFYDLSFQEEFDSLKELRAFKLLRVSHHTKSLPGRRNLNLTRIEGTAFPDKEQLKKFLKKLQAVKQKDHEVVLKNAGILTPLAKGDVVFLPKGALFIEKLKKLLNDFYLSKNYLPLVFSKVVSWHDKESLCKELFLKEFVLAKEPMRFFDIAYYQDKEEVLEESYGLFKTFSYQRDRGVVFCDQSQLLTEVISSLQFINKVVRMFGFEAHWYLVVNSESRDSTHEVVVEGLKQCEIEYTLDKQAKNFADLRVEVRVLDALLREWVVSSLVIDSNGLKVKAESEQVRQITVSLLGPIERCVALLAENDLEMEINEKLF